MPKKQGGIEDLVKGLERVAAALDTIQSKQTVNINLNVQKAFGNLSKFYEQVERVKENLGTLRQEANLQEPVREARKAYTKLRDDLLEVINYSKKVTEELKTHVTIIKAVEQKRAKTSASSTEKPASIVVSDSETTKIVDLAKSFKRVTEEMKGSSYHAKNWIEYFKIIRKVQLDVQSSSTGVISSLKNFIKLAVGARHQLAPKDSIFGQLANTVNKYSAGLANLIYWQARWYATKTLIFGTVGAFREAVRTFIEFDQELKNIQAITSATVTEMAKLSKVIVQVASETKFGLKDIAQAARVFSQAGLSIKETMAALPAAAGLATATLTDLVTVTNLITSTLRSFDVSLENTSRIADIFANAVSNSKLTIEGIGTAFNYVGPVAKQVGLTLEDTAAVMGILANRGIQASTIGTSLRTLFGSLLAPTDKLKKQLAEVGLTVNDINPQLHDFSEILTTLQKSGIQISHIFTGLDRRAAGALAAAVQEGAEGFIRLRNSLLEIGAAEKKARTQLLGMSQTIENLRQNIEIFFINLIEKTKFGEALINVVDNLRLAFINLNQYLSKQETTKYIDDLVQNILRKLETAAQFIGAVFATKLVFSMMYNLRKYMLELFTVGALTNLLSGNIAAVATVIGSAIAGGVAYVYTGNLLKKLKDATQSVTREIRKDIDKISTTEVRVGRVYDEIAEIQRQLKNGELDRATAAEKVQQVLRDNADVLDDARSLARNLGIELTGISSIDFVNLDKLPESLQRSLTTLKQLQNAFDVSILTKQVQEVFATFDTKIPELDAKLKRQSDRIQNRINRLLFVPTIEKAIGRNPEIRSTMQNMFYYLFNEYKGNTNELIKRITGFLNNLFDNDQTKVNPILSALGIDNNTNEDFKKIVTVILQDVDILYDNLEDRNRERAARLRQRLSSLIDPGFDFAKSLVITKDISAENIDQFIFGNKLQERLRERWKNDVIPAMLAGITDPTLRSEVQTQLLSFLDSKEFGKAADEARQQLKVRFFDQLVIEFSRVANSVNTIKSALSNFVPKIPGLEDIVGRFNELRSVEQLIKKTEKRISELKSTIEKLSETDPKNEKIKELNKDLAEQEKLLKKLNSAYELYNKEGAILIARNRAVAETFQLIFKQDAGSKEQLISSLEETINLIKIAQAQLTAGGELALSDKQAQNLASFFGVDVENLERYLKENRPAVEQTIKATRLTIWKNLTIGLSSEAVKRFANILGLNPELVEKIPIKKLGEYIKNKLKEVLSTQKINLAKELFYFDLEDTPVLRQLGKLDFTRLIQLRSERSGLLEQRGIVGESIKALEESLGSAQEKLKQYDSDLKKLPKEQQDEYLKLNKQAEDQQKQLDAQRKSLEEINRKLEENNQQTDQELEKRRIISDNISIFIERLNAAISIQEKSDLILEGFLTKQEKLLRYYELQRKELEQQINIQERIMEITGDTEKRNEGVAREIKIKALGSAATEEDINRIIKGEQELLSLRDKIGSQHKIVQLYNMQLAEQLDLVNELERKKSETRDESERARIERELEQQLQVLYQINEARDKENQQLERQINSYNSISEHLAKIKERTINNYNFIDTMGNGIVDGFKKSMDKLLNYSMSVASTISNGIQQIFDKMGSTLSGILDGILGKYRENRRKVEEEKKRAFAEEQQSYEQELYQLNLKYQLGEIQFRDYQQALVEIEQQHLKKRADIEKKYNTDKLSNYEQLKKGIKDFWHSVLDIITEVIKEIIKKYMVAAFWRMMAGLGGGGSSNTSSGSSGGSGIELMAAKGGLIEKYASGGVINISRYYGIAADGGAVVGGTPNKDSVLALTMPGEYVIRKDVVKQLGVEFFHQLNRGIIDMSSIKRYASGGQVTRSGPMVGRGGSGSSETREIRIYNVIDPSTLPQQPTKDDIINVIRLDAATNGPGIQSIRQRIRG